MATAKAVPKRTHVLGFGGKGAHRVLAALVLVAVAALGSVGTARADTIDLVCKGDSYVYVNNAWQKLDGMQVRILLDLELGELVEYPLAQSLEQFNLRKSGQFVNFVRKVQFGGERVIDELLQINRQSGKVVHMLVDAGSGQRQTVFSGKCTRGRMLF
jgi:hypothetical protein